MSRPPRRSCMILLIRIVACPCLRAGILAHRQLQERVGQESRGQRRAIAAELRQAIRIGNVCRCVLHCFTVRPPDPAPAPGVVSGGLTGDWRDYKDRQPTDNGRSWRPVAFYVDLSVKYTILETVVLPSARVK